MKDPALIDTRGGLFHRNGAGQEQFAWDIRSEPGLIDAFAKIWGTDELLVSVGEYLSYDSRRPEASFHSSPPPLFDPARTLHTTRAYLNL